MFLIKLILDVYLYRVITSVILRQVSTKPHFSEQICCNRKMVRFLVCFLVLVLQVHFIRAQLAHSNFIGGRSDVYEPGYKVWIF